MNWISEELDGVALGDKRLNSRSHILLESLYNQPQVSIPSACGGWSETIAAYRFFQNKKVTAEEILKPHKTSTLKRIKSEKAVLLVQDTTELDYSTKQEKMSGLGVLNWEERRGYHLHPILALTPERLCLGVVDAVLWSRDPQEYGKAKDRRTKPIEEKESIRWVEGYQKATAIAREATETQIVMVADREGDIYEVFEQASESKRNGGTADWLIRANHNRAVDDGKKRTKKTGRVYPKLLDEVTTKTCLGTIEFELRAQRGRKARKVVQSLYAKKMVLRPPERPNKRLPQERIWVLLAREEQPPEGKEAIEWLLITSIPIRSFEQAATLVQWYVCRWQIEVFFRVLKTGCQVEELQLKTTEQLFPCLAFYLIIAWRVLFLTMLGRTCPELPCDVVFDNVEWKAAYAVAHKQSPPKNPPPLNEMIRLIASFGGYLNRQRDPPPGPKAIWIGIQRNRDFAIGILTAQQVQHLL